MIDSVIEMDSNFAHSTTKRLILFGGQLDQGVERYG